MTGDKLRELRERHRLRQQDVADKMGITRATYIAGETGTIPAPKYLKMLSRMYRVSIDWLLTEDGMVPKPGFDLWDKDTPVAEEDAEIPFYKEVELSAGNGRQFAVDWEGRKLRFARSTLYKAGVMPENAACVSVTGTSMEPVLPDGAVVGIDTASQTVRDGQMYAIRQDDLLRVKRIYRIPEGYRISSYNPDRSAYPDETCAKDSLEIIGRVFWYSVLV